MIDSRTTQDAIEDYLRAAEERGDTEYVSPEEAARRLHKSRDTIYRWIKARELVADKMGGGRGVWVIPIITLGGGLAGEVTATRILVR